VRADPPGCLKIEVWRAYLGQKSWCAEFEAALRLAPEKAVPQCEPLAGSVGSLLARFSVLPSAFGMKS
jgi:hypothetical protein